MKYGVTTDDPWSRTADQASALAAFQRKPTLRVVFDEWIKPGEYMQPLATLKPTSYILGEILDSAYMRVYSVAQFKKRVDEYIATLADYVDVWEVGNEVNGEWLGSSLATVQKITYAYDKVKARGGKTALTIYYNKDCWENKKNEMFRWVEENLPARMRDGLDFILVSYYEDDCNNLKPSWPSVFDRVSTLFPNAQMAMGEIGTTRSNKKQRMIQDYYGMAIDHPRFIGGYFWWYFRQDMTPQTKPLWAVLNQELGTY